MEATYTFDHPDAFLCPSHHDHGIYRELLSQSRGAMAAYFPRPQSKRSKYTSPTSKLGISLSLPHWLIIAQYYFFTPLPILIYLVDVLLPG
jgi:hypothetical protein